MTTQRLVDGAGYLINARQGYPFGSQLFDFPGSDGGSLLALWALAKASGSAVWANNVYFLVGFPLNALGAFWCVRRLGISNLTGAAISLLFAILPFHFLRIGHLYFTWYFVVPFYCWLAVELYSGANKCYKRWPLKAAALLALACFGVYYAWFGCMVLFVGAVMGSMRHRSARPICAGMLAIACVGAGVAANILPNASLIREFGKNTAIAQRQPSESEVYGLKIAQLILPRPAHRMERLAAVTARYGQTFPNVNENMTSTLGFVGVIGFFLVLASAVIYFPRVQEQRQSQLFILGASVLFLLLTSTIGGFSALFSLLVSPLIRGWNRVSVFIAFLSLAGVAIAAEGVLERTASTGRAARFSALSVVLLTAFGIWDQTAPGDRQGVTNAQSEYRGDSVFYRKLETSLPEGASIYQLPFMRFPEAEPKWSLGSYDMGKGYLHSRALKWSYGVAAGREGSGFLESLSDQPIVVQLEIARYLGFAGLLIDRRGYSDHGSSIEADLLGHLDGVMPMEDEAKNLAFYSIELMPVATSPSQLSLAAKEWLVGHKARLRKTGGS